jgi:hypothetical protein
LRKKKFRKPVWKILFSKKDRIPIPKFVSRILNSCVKFVSRISFY